MKSADIEKLAKDMESIRKENYLKKEKGDPDEQGVSQLQK